MRPLKLIELLALWAVALAAALMLVGCASLGLTEPEFDFGRPEIIDPLPSHFEESFRWAQECVFPHGQRRRFEAVSFLGTNRITRRSRSGGIILGAFKAPSTIYIVWPYVTETGVVTHEMLHFLMPKARHRDPRFAKCDPFQGAEVNV